MRGLVWSADRNQDHIKPWLHSSLRKSAGVLNLSHRLKLKIIFMYSLKYQQNSSVAQSLVMLKY